MLLTRPQSPAPEALVKSGAIHVVAQCSCGCPEPFLLSILFGRSPEPAECPSCQTKYQLVTMTLNAAEGQLRFGIGSSQPSIVRPGALQ